MTAQPIALPPTEIGVVDFPVMFVALAWIQNHCVIPDGFNKGKPFLLTGWQSWYFANFYRVKWNAQDVLDAMNVPAIGLPAFHYRRCQTVLPQKAGKGPKTAAHSCLEGVGPTMFSGFARGGEQYRCSDHGCPCGWIYTYEPGEPMGIPRPTPLIQITAYSAEQTDNIYDSLRPMIDEGPLSEIIRKTGEEFIRLPGGGRIDTVTSSQLSRLGQRVTFVPQDEVGIWFKANKMDHVAKTQRRGATGMQGRVSEDTNAWDPTELSVAQATATAALHRPDIFRLHPQAPAGLRYTVYEDRRRIHRHVYRGSPWVDLDSINAEAEELLLDDPTNAERFYGNRVVAGLGSWLPDGLWDERVRRGLLVPERCEVAGGFDGSDSDDWTGIRLEVVSGPLNGFRFTPRYGPDRRPTYWDPNDREWGGRIPRQEVHVAMNEISRRYRLRQFFGDPRDWQSELGDWSVKYGDKVIFEWPTYRTVQMHDCLERFVTDLRTGRTFHDDDGNVAEHVGNARKISKPGDRYLLGKPHKERHIDLAMVDALAHEAACAWREAVQAPEPDKISRAMYGFN